MKTRNNEQASSASLNQQPYQSYT